MDNVRRISAAPTFVGGYGLPRFRVSTRQSCSHRLRKLPTACAGRHLLTRREWTRAVVTGTLAGTLATFLGNEKAEAVCGEPDPYWAHYLAWKENVIDVDGRLVHYRVAGKARKERKNGRLPVVCIGECGISMDALDGFELLAEQERRIIRVDTFGTGYSDALPSALQGDTRQTLDAFGAVEIATVLQKLEIGTAKQKFHLLASGTGSYVAMKLLEMPQYRDSVASIILEQVESTGNLKTTVPVCGVEGLERGSQAVLEKYASATDDTPAPELFAKLSGMPTMVLLTDGRKERDANGFGQGVTVSTVRGGTGIPRFDDLNGVVRTLEQFCADVESRYQKKGK